MKTFKTKFQRRNIRKYIITLSSLLSATFFSYAEEPFENDSIPAGQGYEMLEEVVVETAKSVLKSDGATLTYDLDADPTTKSSTVIEMLRKIPSVTVDGEDQIRLNGQTNFKIYVDGREEPTLSENASTILKVMPAESLSRIEVIKEPGAKYDAEGVGGILNLITTRRQTTDGYQGNVSLSLSNRKQNATAYARLKKNKVTSSLNVTYATTAFQPQDNSTFSSRESLNNYDEYLLEQDLKQKFKFNYTDINLKTSWEPNEANLFTLSANFMNMSGHTKECLEESRMYNKIGELQWSDKSQMYVNLGNLSSNVQASYQHSFSKPGHQLIASYQFSYGRNPIDVNKTTESSETYFQLSPTILNQITAIRREHTAQLDYINPFMGDKHLLEAGAKALFRRNSSFSGTKILPDASATTTLPASSTNLAQFQDIGALYVSYTGKFSNLVFKGGIRDEVTHMGINFLDNSGENYASTINDIVPNAALTWSFSPLSNLRLAYQMRISRPSVEQISPYRLSLETGYERTGNPDLQSERNNSISLTYSNFSGALGGNISLTYSRTSNMISNYSYLENDIIVQSIGNFGNQNTTSLSGFLNWRILPFMSLNLNGTIEYLDLRAKTEGMFNCGWSGNFSASFNYRLPLNINMNTFGGKGWNQINLQGHSSGWYYYGISLSRSFLKKDQLNVSLSANNFMAKRMLFHNYTETPLYRLYTRAASTQWSIGIAVSWSFGSLSADVKKTSTAINNNDASTVSNNNSSSTGI